MFLKNIINWQNRNLQNIVIFNFIPTLKPKSNKNYEIVKNSNGTNVAFLKATMSDHKEVVDFLIKEFINAEPLSVSLGLKPENSKGWFQEKIDKSIKEDISFIARAVNESGNLEKLVGAQICTILTRPKSTKVVDFYVKSNAKKTENIEALIEMMESRIWSKLVNVNRLVSLNMISVNAVYLRLGIASKLIELVLEEAKQKGCEGIVTEATAYKSQKLFEKEEYEILENFPYSNLLDDKGNQVFNTKDGANGVQLLYKKL